MTQRTVHTFFTSATAASVTGSARTDFRFEDGGTQRTLFGILTSGAEVNVYIYPDSAQSIEHLESTISIGSSCYTTATNSFLEVFNGPFSVIEVRKAGTSGTATVIGVI